MASITKRGKNQYQALIRRKGYPVQTRTFTSEMQPGRLCQKILPAMTLSVIRRYSGQVTGLGTWAWALGESSTSTHELANAPAASSNQHST